MNIFNFILGKSPIFGGLNPHVYIIKCKANSKVYVGISRKKDLSRFEQHKYLLNKGIHVNYYLQSDWKKYGEDMFDFEIVEYADSNHIGIVEREWIKSYKEDECYNIVYSKQNKRGNIW